MTRMLRNDMLSISFRYLHIGFFLLFVITFLSLSSPAFAGFGGVATGNTTGGGHCQKTGTVCGQNSFGANFGFCVTAPCGSFQHGYDHSSNSQDDTQCGNNALCVVPIHTCAGQTGTTANGVCVGYGDSCQGQQEIITSKNTCINQFKGDGYSYPSDGDIKCCSTFTGSNGSPTVPTATVQNPCPHNQCNTAIGTIDVSTGQAFVTKLFQIILSLSGGIALLLIIYAGYNLTMSQGNPEKVQGARETLTSAIVGLIFIILSLTILQIIGVDILGLFKK